MNTTFKPGQRVRVRDNASWFAGRTGRVVHIASHPSVVYPVEIRLRRSLRQIIRRDRKFADFKAWELTAVTA